ncbi:mRNA-decapping enzyme subunit 2 [Rhodotorula toruloides]|uniref:mRNA-decapping enzyme subunit 2 n=1 Tax=Rhodotorula toruloides TaxID=5286 RepID=A0A511KLJ0_RHOTO|nr:mRNA-decapping enzyme subunit 2 [Rhodotorula toruloides]
MSHLLHPPQTSGIHQSSFASLQLEQVLDDLAARFIVNLPQEELESMDRVCFQIEQAHWYYEDFIRPTASNPSLLPSYSLKAFSLLMFKSCPLLHDLVPQHQTIWESFMKYKERVPVCGAVLINEWWDKVLLVKGWTKGSAWSFPRGKINKQEPEAMCAVREVLEETGFDLSPYFPPEQLDPSYIEPEGQERHPYYVELVIREQKIRLYFVPGVSESTRFETRTRKEISKIDWFRLSDLPTWSKDANSGGKKKGSSARTKGELANGKQAKFYMVTPFISHLKLWIDRNKPKNIPVRPGDPPAPFSPPPFSPPSVSAPSRSPILVGGRVLKPWVAGDFETSTEEEETTTDEDDGVVEGARRQAWETTQQGTQALEALFFGSPPQSQRPPLPSHEPPQPHFPSANDDTPPLRPLPVPTTQPVYASSGSVNSFFTATPPQVAYERQQSFVQPKPKSSSNQQARLLELFSGQGGTPPPHAQQPQGSYAQGNLVGMLEGMALASPSPLPPLASTSHPTFRQQQTPSDMQQEHDLSQAPQFPPHAHPELYHHAASPLTAHASLLFSAQPPPETLSAPPRAPITVTELEESQRKEKHDALLRALLTVAAKSPPRKVDLELEQSSSFTNCTRGSGYRGTPEDVERLFRPAAGASSSAPLAGQAVDYNGWPLPTPPASSQPPPPPQPVQQSHPPTSKGSLLSILNKPPSKAEPAPPPPPLQPTPLTQQHPSFTHAPPPYPTHRLPAAPYAAPPALQPSFPSAVADQPYPSSLQPPQVTLPTSFAGHVPPGAPYPPQYPTYPAPLQTRPPLPHPSYLPPNPAQQPFPFPFATHPPPTGAQQVLPQQLVPQTQAPPHPAGAGRGNAGQLLGLFNSRT